jgi:hypothetical protein
MMKRKEEEINPDEMEPPGNWAVFCNFPAVTEAEKNRCPEMMVNKAIL